MVGDDHDEVGGGPLLSVPLQQTIRLHLARSYCLLGQLAQDGGHGVPGVDLNQLQPAPLVEADSEVRVGVEKGEDGEADGSQAVEVPGTPAAVIR